jgi:predicted ATP-grasp superfamily ATP-dependent carboligase
MNKKNVLVFPGGSEIGLEVNRSLSASTHFNLFGASSVIDHGKYVYKEYISNLPFIHESAFIEELNKVLLEYKIDFIVPAHDSVVVELSEKQSLLKALVITSNYETCLICRSKKLTSEIFRNTIPVPQMYSLSDKINYPVFLKPNIGQGSRGTHKVQSKEEIDFFLKEDPSLLIMEYLPGKEYTVDCFTDSNGKLLFAEGRERIRINNGISVNSKKCDDKIFLELDAPPLRNPKQTQSPSFKT